MFYIEKKIRSCILMFIIEEKKLI